MIDKSCFQAISKHRTEISVIFNNNFAKRFKFLIEEYSHTIVSRETMHTTTNLMLHALN